LGVSTNCSRVGAFPRREGGIQVLAGLALSSQTVMIHFETPRAGKAGRKNSAKSGLREFTLTVKYTQLLLIKRIRQSKKFNKLGFYHGNQWLPLRGELGRCSTQVGSGPALLTNIGVGWKSLVRLENLKIEP
jgi:hypothetical protein